MIKAHAGIFIIVLLFVVCQKKVPEGTAELKALLIQTNTLLSEIVPMLDERAKPEAVRMAVLKLEKVLANQYSEAKAILKKYPGVMNERTMLEPLLNPHMISVRENMGLISRRIKYWQKRLPNDQIFNATIKRTAKMSSQVEMETRPPE